MAKATKDNAATVSPELAAADEAAANVSQRWLDMWHQRRDAEKQVTLGAEKRNALIARAKAGEVVQGSEVAEIEAEIRAAESTAALLSEALPALLKEVAKAESRLTEIARKPLQEAAVAADKRFQDAKEAKRAAEIEHAAAWQAFSLATGALGPYTPDELYQGTRSDGREDRLERCLRIDRAEAEARRDREARQAAATARNAEIETRRFYAASGRF